MVARLGCGNRLSAPGALAKQTFAWGWSAEGCLPWGAGRVGLWEPLAKTRPQDPGRAGLGPGQGRAEGRACQRPGRGDLGWAGPGPAGGRAAGPLAGPGLGRGRRRGRAEPQERGRRAPSGGIPRCRGNGAGRPGSPRAAVAGGGASGRPQSRPAPPPTVAAAMLRHGSPGAVGPFPRWPLALHRGLPSPLRPPTPGAAASVAARWCGSFLGGPSPLVSCRHRPCPSERDGRRVMALLRLLLLRGRCGCWRRPAPPPDPAWARARPRPGGGPLGAGRGLQVTGRRSPRSGVGRPRGGASPPPCSAGSAAPSTGRERRGGPAASPGERPARWGARASRLHRRRRREGSWVSPQGFVFKWALASRKAFPQKSAQVKASQRSVVSVLYNGNLGEGEHLGCHKQENAVLRFFFPNFIRSSSLYLL